jgi:hypothetical protein
MQFPPADSDGRAGNRPASAIGIFAFSSAVISVTAGFREQLFEEEILESLNDGP